jgi:hypothetical protein
MFGMKRIFILVMLASAFIPIYSDSLIKIASTKILFGKAPNEIGLEKGGGEHWKPLFFSVGNDGLIYIPDFYKNRIAAFDSKGKLVRSIQVKEGISPRMNYFSLASSGRYVAFSDYTLYLIGKDGALVWKRQLGYGAIPESLYANGVGVFLVLPGDDERAIVFDYATNQPIGRYGFKNDSRGVPMIQSEGKANFTFSISDMKLIPESGFAKSAFSLLVNAYLVSVDASNKSLWKKKNEGSEEIYLFSATGKLEKRATIVYEQSETEGNGFWTTSDEKLAIYKNYFFDDYMLIVSYQFN